MRVSSTRAQPRVNQPPESEHGNSCRLNGRLFGTQRQDSSAQVHVTVSESTSATRVADAPLNILVVHEMLPHPDRHGADVQWMQMLGELRAQGQEVVHVARSGINRAQYAAGVEKLGIRVLTPDAERMRYLGFDFPVE